jgi:hypothetical protein
MALMIECLPRWKGSGLNPQYKKIDHPIMMSSTTATPTSKRKRKALLPIVSKYFNNANYSDQQNLGITVLSISFYPPFHIWLLSLSSSVLYPKLSI